MHGALLADTGELSGALAFMRAALKPAGTSGVIRVGPKLEAQAADSRAGRPTRITGRGR